MTTASDDNENQEEPLCDVDGNVVIPIKMGPDDVTRFGALLIDTLFGNGIKDDTPPETRTQMLAEIQAMCLIRGINKLGEDIDKLDGAMRDALSRYDRTVTGQIQSAANTLYAVEKDDEQEMSDADMAMLDFLKSVGVKHMKPRRESASPIAGLIQQLMRSQGEMSDEDFEASIHEQLDRILSGPGGEPTQGCDCPGCRMKRELLANAKGAAIAATSEEGDDMSNHPDGVFAGLPGAKALREAREAADPPPEDAPPPTAVTAE